MSTTTTASWHTPFMGVHASALEHRQLLAVESTPFAPLSGHTPGAELSSVSVVVAHPRLMGSGLGRTTTSVPANDDDDVWFTAAKSEADAAVRVVDALTVEVRQGTLARYAAGLREALAASSVRETPTTRARLMALALVVARTVLVDAIRDYPTWVRVVRALDPDAAGYPVPRRLLTYVAEEGWEWPSAAEIRAVRHLDETLADS